MFHVFWFFKVVVKAIDRMDGVSPEKEIERVLEMKTSQYDEYIRAQFHAEEIKPAHYADFSLERSWSIGRVLSAVAFPLVWIGTFFHRLFGRGESSIVDRIGKGMKANRVATGVGLGLTKEEAFFDHTIHGDWRFVRLSVLMEGLPVEVVVYTSSKALQSKRWILHTEGAGADVDYSLLLRSSLDKKNTTITSIAREAKSSLLFFSSAGQGRSGASWPGPSAEEKAKSHYATRLLAEKLGAEVLYSFGYCMGGVIQRDSLERFSACGELKERMIFLMTAKSIPVTMEGAVSGEAGWIAGKVANAVTRVFGWNVATREIRHKHLVIQRGQVVEGEVQLQDDEMFRPDQMLVAGEEGELVTVVQKHTQYHRTKSVETTVLDFIASSS